jgi:MFS family permease
MADEGDGRDDPAEPHDGPDYDDAVVESIRLPGGGGLEPPDMSGRTESSVRIRQFRRLLPPLLREEVRMQISFTSRWAFTMFIVLIFLFSLTSGLLFGQIIERIPPADLYFMVHMSVLMFSLLLGMAALSETFSTSHHFILADTVRYPVHPRTARAAVLVREAVFALTFLFLPLILGIALSLPFSGRNPNAALVHIAGLLLTFELGLALSFAIMALATGPAKRVAGYLMFTAPVFIGAVLYHPLDYLLPGYRLSEIWIDTHVFGWHLLAPAVYLPVVLSIPGILYIGAMTFTASSHPNKLRELTDRFDMRQPYRDLVPQEYLQLRRSRGLQKIVGSYLFPLVIMSIMMLYIRLAIGPVVQSGLTFYVPLVGLISTTIYSWENNIDDHLYFSLLPISMSELIRSKLILFFILAGFFSTGYTLLMAAVLGSHPAEIAFAVPAAFLLSAYTGTVTAYLTGIDPNRKLFDPVTLARFFVLTSAPLIILLLASQQPSSMALPSIGFVGLLALLTYIIWQKIGKKWAHEPFV